MKRTRAEIARANGAKSKGPVTPEGKAKSSRNAVTHALTAYKAFVLQNESYDCFEKLVLDLAGTYQPEGEHERHLVWQIAGTIWRERRLWDTETALIDMEMDRQLITVPVLPNGMPDEAIRTAKAFESLADNSHALSLVLRYQSRMVRTRERALESLRSVQAERRARHAQIAAETPEEKVEKGTQEAEEPEEVQKTAETVQRDSTDRENAGKVGDVRLNKSDEPVTNGFETDALSLPKTDSGWEDQKKSSL